MATKRYQVFVSSTFTDLREERREVMQALLELRFIPAGMELFQAANKTPWQLIERVIDECDYYIVIVGSRYGSTDDAGLSFTEKEYDYAVSLNKPVIGFLKQEPGDLRQEIAAFRAKVEKGRHVRYWTSPLELAGQVSRGLALLSGDEPGVGWIRADEAADETEVLALRRTVDELQKRLSTAEDAQPPGVEKLAQGDDPAVLVYSYRLVPTDDVMAAFYVDKIPYEWGRFQTTWNIIFSVLGPLMFTEATDSKLRSRLEELILGGADELQALSGKGQVTVDLQSASFDTVRVQLRALNLIRPGTVKRSAKDSQTYWQLTPFGERYLTRIRALPRFVTLASTEDRPFVAAPPKASKQAPKRRSK